MPESNYSWRVEGNMGFLSRSYVHAISRACGQSLNCHQFSTNAPVRLSKFTGILEDAGDGPIPKGLHPPAQGWPSRTEAPTDGLNSSVLDLILTLVRTLSVEEAEDPPMLVVHVHVHVKPEHVVGFREATLE